MAPHGPGAQHAPLDPDELAARMTAGEDDALQAADALPAEDALHADDAVRAHDADSEAPDASAADDPAVD
jgi:hypothetical protein